MKTILETIRLAEGYLSDKGIPNPRLEAERLIADVFNLNRIDLYMQFDRPIEEEELEKCRQALKRRGNREPSQYISGKIHFAGLKLIVNPSVLIPRQETEILVEKISESLSRMPLEGKIMLDMCTGSGCIGLALKKRFPELNVFLTDISSEALLVASKNAESNACEVTVLEGDLFEPFKGQSCDFFVCNPPYISEKEFQCLDPEVRMFEPKKALVGGVMGTEFYKRLARELPSYLKPSGKAWMEIGHQQGDHVKSIFESSNWTHMAIEKDWSGHDRFFSLERDSFLI